MPTADTVQGERARRFDLWRQLKEKGGPDDLLPAVLKDLRVHRGQQGVFRDLERTESLPNAPSGVAVGLRHTGSSYEDDLSDEGVVYHYPETARGRRDVSEVAAIKACLELSLPLFVVITPHRGARTRNVRLGWVTEHDDGTASALIMFSEAQPPPSQTLEGEAPFVLRASRAVKTALARIRPNQWRFRFDVLKRYGRQCALCPISHQNLLEAAHLCPVEEDGTDDPRNGIVFCLNHHRAFDQCLVGIDPDSHMVVCRPGIPAAEIAVARDSIRHLRRLPHATALTHAWRRYCADGCDCDSDA